MALRTRHEYKIAQLYEMRSLSDKALLHYQESYQALANLGAKWEEDGKLEYSLVEVRGAAELIHYRLCALKLEAGEARAALAQLKVCSFSFSFRAGRKRV